MKISRILFCVISFFIFSNQALANLSFSVQNEKVSKTKILFLGFDSNDPALKSDSFNIFDRIRSNLKTTDLFKVARKTNKIEIATPGSVITVSAAKIVKKKLLLEAIPDFEKYAKAGIGAIVIGQFNYDVVGNLELRVRMWDVLDQRQLFGKYYTSSKDNYRKVSNIISNEIFKSITGEVIAHFSSKILYVSETGSISKRVKKIRRVDFDGNNNQVLTDGRDLVLTPIFSKNKNEIFYLRFFQQKSQIYSLDLRNLRSNKVGGFRGTTFAASIHPKDQNLLLLSAIDRGNSDIYELNISSNSASRLTKNPAIDTTPSYSPNGKFITFASDRDSGQQIYVMDSKGLSISRITSEKGSYSKPVWSPDGKLIAFTKMSKGKFFIGIIAPNGKGERLLVSDYLVEGAKWSPSGRYLIYSKKKSRYGRGSIPRLYIIDVITGFEFEVPTPPNEGATDPDWA